MPRRNRHADGAFSDLIDVFGALPIWVGPFIAAGAYVLIRFLVAPILHSTGSDIGRVFGGMARNLAWIGPLLVLAAWGISLIGRRSKRRLFERQTGLESIRKLSWVEFETLVGESFRRKGYQVCETGSPGPDGGVDLVLNKDGEKTLVQCKQWKSWSVGVRVVRELYGVMASTGAEYGVIVTCGRFSKEAIRFAQGKPMELVDGSALASLVSEGKMPPKPSIERPKSEAAFQCPNCGSPMIRRTAKKGRQPGSQFWGCTRFPACRGTLPS